MDWLGLNNVILPAKHRSTEYRSVNKSNKINEINPSSVSAEPVEEQQRETMLGLYRVTPTDCTISSMMKTVCILGFKKGSNLNITLDR